jgi:hypothetical protein
MILSLVKPALAPVLLKFRSELRRPREAQQRLLRRLLRNLSLTEYGRKLKVKNDDDYQAFAAKAPLVRYDDIAEWVERQQREEGRVLAAERVLCYEPTSGSSGAAKFIPYTAGLKRSFNRMFLVWLADLLRHGPPLKTGRVFLSGSPAFAQSRTTARGVKVGLEDDTEYLRGWARLLMRRFLAAPPSVRRLQDPSDFKHALAALLVAEPRLEAVSVWNPSFFDIILDYVERNGPALAADLRRGSLARGGVEFKFAPVAEARLKLIAGSPIRWERVWPELKLISCWASAHAADAARALAEKFPHTFLQGKGLLATEAPMTLPLIAAAGSVPLPSEVFYEFLDERGRVSRLDELEAGREYEIVVTQRGGLTRYRVGDRVRVTHFFEGVPCLEFVGRADDVCDLVGEKLSEEFVRRCLTRLAPRPGHFQILLPVKQPRAHYLLLTEDVSSPAEYADRVDEALSESFHYRSARLLGQLGAVALRVVPQARELYYGYFVGRGMKWGDIKQRDLLKDVEDAARLIESLRD